MDPLHEGKTVWETSEFNQDPVLSTLKLLFQNITDQLYNHQFLPNFETASFPSQENVKIVKNMTMALFSDSFKISEPSLEYAFEIVLLLRAFLQYFAAFVTILIFTWIFNKLILKSNLMTGFIETVGSYILLVPVFPPIAGFFGVLMTLRMGIWAYLKIFYNSKDTKKISLVSPLDSFWAYETYGSCSSCVGLYIIEGTCDPKKVRERTKKTVESDLVGGKMSRKLTSVLGFPCWEVLEKMDMEDYVKVVLDTGSPSSETDVFDFLKSTQDKLVVDRAPWTVYIIPDFIYDSKSSSQKSLDASSNSKSHYAVIFRIHHGIMDGISTGNILHSVMADEPFKFSVDPIEPFGSKPSKLKTSLAFLLGMISLPRVIIRNIFLTDNQHNRFYLPGPCLTGPKTFTWSRPIKMAGLKQLKNSLKTSVFNVLLSSLGGAYRQLCLKNGKAPESDYFHAMSPVALLPYPDRKPRNRFSGLLVPVFVGKGRSPLKRLELNHSNIKQLGGSTGTAFVMGNYYFPMLVGVMPLFLQKIFSSLLHVKMSISNVPGPKTEVRIYGGDKIVEIGIWVPIKLSVGLGMGLFSMGDRVRATVIGDKVYFPNECDVQFIADAFENELNYLVKAVGLPEDTLFFAD